MLGTKCKALLVPLLVLSACATTHGVQIQYVDRPVIQVQKCLKVTDVPTKPDSLKSHGVPGSLDQALSVALAKVSEWTRYGNKVDVVIQGCVSSSK